MRVLCIDGKWEGPAKPPFPKENEVYEAVATHKYMGDDYYSLIGYKFWYETVAFLPLSEIDELVLVNNKELVQ